jgi:phage terminase large subunit
LIELVEDIIGFDLWEKQEEILNDVFLNNEKKIFAVKACTGAGKTKLAAVIAAWWLLTKKNSSVVTTAPTTRQVRELLWKEIRSIAKTLIDKKIWPSDAIVPVAPQIRLGNGWGAIGFASNDDVNLQGWHSEGGTLVIVDEANGFDRAQWDSLAATLTGDNDKLFAIGNPTRPSGAFYDLFKKNSPNASLHTISAFDTPNVIAGKTLIDGLTTKSWIETRRHDWGEQSPLWKARVLGEFPDSDIGDSLCPLSWFTTNKDIPNLKEYKTICGVDLARLGADNTVAVIIKTDYKNYVVEKVIELPKSDGMRTAENLAVLCKKFNIDRIQIDADGLGAPIFDRCRQIIKGAEVIEIRGGTSSTNPDRFANSRAENLHRVREIVNPDGDYFFASKVNLDKIANQANNLRMFETVKGQIKIETKAEYKARNKKSPDELDALSYALYQPPQRRKFVLV